MITTVADFKRKQLRKREELIIFLHINIMNSIYSQSLEKGLTVAQVCVCLLWLQKHVSLAAMSSPKKGQTVQYKLIYTKLCF